MKNIKLALIAASVFASTSAIASNNINFANPNAVYSGASLGYESDGVYFDAQFGLPISNQWGMLGKYTGAEGFDNHNFSLGAIHNNGFGFKLTYDNDSTFGEKDLKANSSDISIHYMLGGDQGFALIPEFSIGAFKHEDMNNRSYYSDLAVNAIYNTSFGLWASVAPQYTYSYNDLKHKNNSRDSFREWDISASVGFNFLKSHSLAYEYNYVDSDHQSRIKYSIGF